MTNLFDFMDDEFDNQDDFSTFDESDDKIIIGDFDKEIASHELFSFNEV